jgi:hypothetical protein
MNVDVLYVRLLKKGLSPYEATAQALAWASLEPKPLDSDDQIVAWAYGRAIRLQHGMVEL